MRIRLTALCLGLLMLAGCQDDAPVGPTTADFNQARTELMTKLKKGKGKAKLASAPVAPKSNPDGEGMVGAKGFQYDARGKRDPFRSFHWQQLQLEMVDAEARGPLEQFDISQLSVVGVVWDVNNAKALVQDPSGMSYIVGAGARIGKNDGRVISIGDNLMVVKETYVDWMGEETTKDIEMRIRGTEGG